MKYTEIKEKSKEELTTLLKDKKLLLFELKVKQKTMQLTKTSDLKVVKKDIAKIKTAISAIG
ncbi:MAG: 50S ribosomal protein L29 [Campylobacteraceae bacterium 4484_166]|nr:MAG: 50S ribosomal protein L29 [Campylobacteraceae bacterium 4484_166]